MCVLSCVCVCVRASSVYSGHQSILIPPVELESNPALWLLAVSQLKVRDTFCSYSVMELCTKGLGLQTDALKVGLGGLGGGWCGAWMWWGWVFTGWVWEWEWVIWKRK